MGKKEECFLYDSANIRPDWSKHLTWLAQELKAKLTTVTTDGLATFLEDWKKL